MHIIFSASLLAVGATIAGMVATPAYSNGVVQNNRVIGYQDPQTGTFRQLNAIVPKATGATTGTVDVTFDIKILSTFAAGTVISCSAQVIAFELSTTSSTVSYIEEGTATATVSGSTATCTVKIPYSWQLLPAGSVETESFSGNYSVIAVGTSGTASRLSSSAFVSATTIPASGTVSKYTVDVTL